MPTARACYTARVSEGRYWDFGTAARYWSSMRGVMEMLARGEADPFIDFLLETGTFDRTLFDPAHLSYGTPVAGLINLGGHVIRADHPPGVVISGPGAPAFASGVQLCYGEIVQTV